MKHWLEYLVAGTMLALVVGLPLAGVAVAFVSGLLTKQPVVMFREVPAPLAPDAYRDAMIHAATREHGFRWVAAGEHSGSPDVRAALVLSPDMTTIAIIGAGRIWKIHTKLTLLHSRLADGGAIVTLDDPGTGELDPLTQREAREHTDFSELWRLHAARVSDAGDAILTFPADATWADLDAAYAARVERMVAAGMARYVDPSRTRYRHTLVGSFRATIIHGIKQAFAPRTAARMYRPPPPLPTPPTFAVVAGEEIPLAMVASPAQPEAPAGDLNDSRSIDLAPVPPAS